MPRTLDETYKRMLLAIEDMYQVDARKALMWLTLSERPISVAELAEACSISFTDGDDIYVEDNGKVAKGAIEGLLGVISSMVVVEQGPIKPSKPRLGQELDYKFSHELLFQNIRLAHFSVKEYLISRPKDDKEVTRYQILESEAHTALAQDCCAYIMYFTGSPSAKSWLEKEAMPKQSSDPRSLGSQNFLSDFTPAYPLLPYAVRYWHIHQAQVEQGGWRSKPHCNLHLRLLENEDARVSWLRLVDLKGSMHDYAFRPPMSPRGGEGEGEAVTVANYHDGTTPLYWAAVLGFQQTLSALYLPTSTLDLDRVAGRYGTALQAAAYFGHYTIVQMLLQAGADVNKLGGYYNTALVAAAILERPKRTQVSQYEKIVEVLLRAGAKPNIEEGLRNYRTALITAVKAGNTNIVEMLLAAGADVNVIIAMEYTERSQLEEGSEDEETALLIAIWEGSVEMVNILIEAGADVNMEVRKRDKPITPLFTAVLRGRLPVIEMLIWKGAGVGGNGLGVYKAMSRKSRHKAAIAAVLLSAGVRLGATVPPLFYAIHAGSEESVRMLLGANADVNRHVSVDRYGPANTPLMLAAVLGQDNLVQLLLAAGADANGYSIASKHLEDSEDSESLEDSETLEDLEYAEELREMERLGLPSFPTYENALSRAEEFALHKGRPHVAGELAISLSIIRRLLDAGADIHAGGDVALWKAVRSNWAEAGDNCDCRLKLSEFLLVNNANANGQHTNPNGHFRYSILWGLRDFNLAKLLLDNGADVNKPPESVFKDLGTWRLMNVLHKAGADQERDLVRLYLDWGANVEFEDASEALDLATSAFDQQYYSTAKHEQANQITTMIMRAMISVKGRDHSIFRKMLEIEVVRGQPTHPYNYWRSILEQLLSETVEGDEQNPSQSSGSSIQESRT